jgi:hypothetical protein
MRYCAELTKRLEFFQTIFPETESYVVKWLAPPTRWPPLTSRVACGVVVLMPTFCAIQIVAINEAHEIAIASVKIFFITEFLVLRRAGL